MTSPSSGLPVARRVAVLEDEHAEMRTCLENLIEWTEDLLDQADRYRVRGLDLKIFRAELRRAERCLEAMDRRARPITQMHPVHDRSRKKSRRG